MLIGMKTKSNSKMSTVLRPSPDPLEGSLSSELGLGERRVELPAAAVSSSGGVHDRVLLPGEPAFPTAAAAGGCASALLASFSVLCQLGVEEGVEEIALHLL